MTQKKLLICSPSHALRGGVETIVHDLCRELPRYGWAATLALGKGHHFNNVDAYRKTYPGIPILEVDGAQGTRQSRLEALTRTIKSQRPDVVLVARIFDAYEVTARLKRLGGGPRLALTIQAYEPQHLYDARLYRDSIDLCVTSGRMIRQAAMDWSGLPGERVISIPGGVSHPSKPCAPRRPKAPIRIAYVGRIEQEQKRILDIEPFLRHLDDERVDYLLDVVGTGPLEGELRRRLDLWTKASKLRFWGWQSKGDLYDRFFPMLDCVVHFAHTEGVTIAPREAMVHGVVPVISEFIGLKTERHFIHGVNALTFPVGHVATAARHIKRLFEEPDLLTQLSRSAMESQTEEYSADGAIQAWAEAFDGCLRKELRSAQSPMPKPPPDGRLARFGLSPWLAQRIRNLVGRRHFHTEPGGEWPSSSGFMTTEAATELLRFASAYEDGRSSE